VSTSERGPDALLPLWAARLLGFAALASLGALEWQRMVAGLSSGRALLWVAAATAAGALVIACDRVPLRWYALALPAATAAGLIAAIVVSGIPLEYLKPRNWGELIDGVTAGAQSLGTVRMPYDGADPWPRYTLQVGGALLLVLSAQLACWPRGGDARGYPFLSLVGLLVLVVSPVVSLGGTRPLLLGTAIAALTICFLWLERMPLRPGLGVAALLGIALAGALPLAAVADRGEPWFDYKAFAEGIGPDDPVRFSWDQDYGPIDWPRDGNEVMRVASEQPHYWKAANLSTFDGTGWTLETPDEGGGDDFTDELREDWRNKPGWIDTIEVSIRRMRTLDVMGPGTIMEIDNATRPLQPSGVPGRWTATSELRRGDSYTAEVYDPEPTAGELRQANRTGYRVARSNQLEISMPFLVARRPTVRSVGGVTTGRIDEAVVHFRPFGDDDVGYVTYPEVRRTRYDAIESTFRRSPYERTWQLAKEFRAVAETPYEYILLVNNYLRGGDFGYSERPQQPPAGRAPLDAFLIDTKEGYCQHFAGAMALLLRMGGIPARVATGFSPGGFSKRRDAWIVRDTDAHAWVEAWFDDLGWITYDPTPDATPARSQIAALEAAPDPVPAAPTEADSVTGDGAGSQQSGVLRPNLLFDPLRNNPDTAPDEEGGGVAWWNWVLVALGAALVAFVLVRWLRAVRRRGAMSPPDRAVFELEAALRRAGRPLPTGTTLQQLERRLGASSDATAYLRALSASRYGPAPTLPTAAQRKALRRALAQGLGPAGKLRALWALPPRPR
jgi:transglutaminase-like putative cysteine protease